MSDQEQAAEISVGDAGRIARMLREWNVFKRSTGGDTQGDTQGLGIDAVAPFAFVIPTSAASVTIGTGGAYQWKYRVDVVANPTGHKLATPLEKLATGQVGLNTCEFSNTSTKVMGVTIYPSGASKCNDAIGCNPITTNFANLPLPAWLYWVWFESGDPNDGYFAWHFTMPNSLVYNEDPTDTTR